MRTWKTSDGSYSVSAQLIGVEGDNIVLHRLDGVKIKPPRRNLSIEDLQYVNSIAETQFDSEDDADTESTGDEQGERSVASKPPKAVSARIRSYVFASDLYWFHVEALLEDGRTWKLARNYQDFYDLQTALLDQFPEEAGRTGTQSRTLPHMPDPVNHVTNAITEGRMHKLDAYVKHLVTLSPRVSGCMVVRKFFRPRDGDEELSPIKWSYPSAPRSAAEAEAAYGVETPIATFAAQYKSFSGGSSVSKGSSVGSLLSKRLDALAELDRTQLQMEGDEFPDE